MKKRSSLIFGNIKNFILFLLIFFKGLSIYSQTTIYEVDSPIKKVQGGNGTSWVLFENGQLWGVGDNNYKDFSGATGITRQTIWIKVGDDFSDFGTSIHNNSYWGIKNGGDLYTWGYNFFGCLGHGKRSNSENMKFVIGGVKKVSMSYKSMYLLTEDGKLYSTGGLGSSTSSDVDKTYYINRMCNKHGSSLQLFLENDDNKGLVSDIKTGLNDFDVRYFVRDGVLYSSGDNNFGQLGIDRNGSQNGTGWMTSFDNGPDCKGFNIMDNATDISIITGFQHVLVLKDGCVWGAGENGNNQVNKTGGYVKLFQKTYGLGSGDLTTGSVRFVKIGITNIYGNIALDDKGRIWQWGLYNIGGLNKRSIPEVIDTGYVDIGSGNYQIFGIKRDGSLWGMGNNIVPLSTKVISSSTTTLMVKILDPIKINFNLVEKEKITCKGGNNGIIAVRGLSGGSGGYKLSYRLEGSTPWITTNVEGDTLVKDLGVGKYELKITDVNTIEHVELLELIEPESIIISLNILKLSDPLLNDGEIEIKDIKGGNGDYSISYREKGSSTWIPTVEPTITGLGKGEYIFKVIDKKGCEKIDTILLQSVDIKFDTEVYSPICKLGNEGSIILKNIEGVIGDYRVLFKRLGDNKWDTLVKNESRIENLTSGFYDIKVITTELSSGIVNIELIESTYEINYELYIKKEISCDNGYGEIGIRNITGVTGDYILMYRKKGDVDWYSLDLNKDIKDSLDYGLYEFKLTDSKCESEINEIELKKSNVEYDYVLECGNIGGDIKINILNREDINLIEYSLYKEGDIIEYTSLPEDLILKGLKDGDYILSIRDKGKQCSTEKEILVDCCLSSGISCIGSILMNEESVLTFPLQDKYYRIDLVIISSNGNVSYKSENYINGTLKGSELLTGIYFYIIKVYQRDKDSLIFIKQDFIDRIK